MSKLVLFLFLGVCAIAMHMVFADEGSNNENDAALEALVNAMEPKLLEQFSAGETRFSVNWKEVWEKVKPILIQFGKMAGEAAISAAGK